MKYLLLIYSNPVTWGHPIFEHTAEGLAMSDDERARLGDQLHTLISEIIESGELLGMNPLADPAISRTVRVRDDAPVVTDGPYLEAKEQMAGYFLLDCASLERAEEIAARFPEARISAVEIRPVMGPQGEEM